MVAATSVIADDPALRRGGVEAADLGCGGNLPLVSDAAVMATYLVVQLRRQ